MSDEKFYEIEMTYQLKRVDLQASTVLVPRWVRDAYWLVEAARAIVGNEYAKWEPYAFFFDKKEARDWIIDAQENLLTWGVDTHCRVYEDDVLVCEWIKDESTKYKQHYKVGDYNTFPEETPNG